MFDSVTRSLRDCDFNLSLSKVQDMSRVPLQKLWLLRSESAVMNSKSLWHWSSFLPGCELF